MLTQNIPQGCDHRSSAGKLLVVGIGPGSRDDRTFRAVKAIEQCEVVVGYHKYMLLVEDLLDGKECIATGMTQERRRVSFAIERARMGARVALISSGDAGVYGMAGLALEVIAAEDSPLAVEIIPGVTAANSAAARLGAPLMLDYCCISLSDLMIQWSQIEKRLHAAGAGDFVVALYNPRSVKRRRHLEETVRILLEYRQGETPVGIVDHIGLENESVVHATLGALLTCEIGMRSTVIIGNSSSRCLGQWLVTPRGYENS